ncbi:MAG: hypothetical protein M1819_006959 [Sarea resinae]|nr:MAG: hypothetical protein M1819_006959 [Sarea resinae]
MAVLVATAVGALHARATTLGTSGDTSQSSPPPHGSWMHRHYRWIVMLIVVFLGLFLLAICTFFLRRHFKRKADAKRARISGGGPGVGMAWGPHQAQSQDKGFDSVRALGEYSGTQEMTRLQKKGKGKGKEGVVVNERSVDGDVPSSSEGGHGRLTH